jgi:hypothetical protein
VLERLFAATPRGAALINRIKSDPHLAHAEVRVMSHTGDYTRQVVKPTAVRTPGSPAAATGPTATAAASSASSIATEEAPKALDWHGTRRAPRFRVRSGVELQLDGNPAAVVDLSTVGAQVISPTVLRPNQKVRISLPNEDFLLRFRGAVAWAKFELPKGPAQAPQYRAGVEFTDARRRRGRLGHPPQSQLGPRKHTVELTTDKHGSTRFYSSCSSVFIGGVSRARTNRRRSSRRE